MFNDILNYVISPSLSHKNDDCRDPNNFRSISLISYISKLSILNRRLLVCNNNDLLSDAQFGFGRKCFI